MAIKSEPELIDERKKEKSMRVKYSEVFEQNSNGSFTPRVVVRIGGVTMGPGVAFSQGVSFSVIDIAKLARKDLEVEQYPDGVVEIKGVYYTKAH